MVPDRSGVRIEIRPCRDWLVAAGFLLGGGFMAAIFVKLTGGFFHLSETGPWIFGLVITAVFGLIAFGLLRFALFCLADRLVLDLRKTGLRAETFLGPFRQAQEVRREQVRWIEVEDGPLSVLEELPVFRRRAALRLKESEKRVHRIALGLTRDDAWKIVALYRRHVEGRETAPPAGPKKRVWDQPPPASGIAVWIRGVLAVWGLSLFPVFLVGALGLSLPRWLEPPWNDLSDYVVGADGRIWLHIGLYDTFLIYDSEGRFQASRPGPGSQAGGKCLAAAADGRVFVLNFNTVHTFSSDGEPAGRISADRKGSRVWRLADDGAVELVPDPPPEVLAPDRLIRPGEILFGGACHKPRPHLAFRHPEVGTVRRHFGPWLEIEHPDGGRVSFAGPWYFFWAQIPFLYLPWVALLIWDWIERRQRKPTS